MTDYPLPTSENRNSILALPHGELPEIFHPGHWHSRHQTKTRSFAAVSGCYERSSPITGSWLSNTTHYFDLRLAPRSADNRGRFADAFDASVPMGEILFVPAGHRYIGTGGIGKQRNLFVFLNAETLQQDTELLEKLINPGVLRYCMDLRSDAIHSLLKQIARELYQPGFASELMMEGLGTTLLAGLARHLHQRGDQNERRGGLSTRSMHRVNERITQGEIPPSLSELAALCQLSQRHLMRAFREQTGHTIGEFMKQTMIRRAVNLLRNSDRQIASIAGEVGFTNAAAFSTAFRRVTGKTPREFRAEQRSQR